VRWQRQVGVLLTVILCSGCGGESTDDAKVDDKPSLQGGVRPDSRPAVTLESLGGQGTIQGVVRFEGTVPKSRIVSVAGKYCIEKRGSSFVDPDMLVDGKGRVQNVFVYLQGGVPEYRFAVAETPVQIDQTDCQFEPRVVGVQVGQPLHFTNQDATLHNVHSVVDKKIGNKAFNFGMSGRQDVVIEKKFDTSEIMTRIKCDVHPWMVSWVGVLPHPWFSVTDESGAFRIPQVPDGEYIVAAWHERLGSTSARVRVEGGVSSPLEILFPEPRESRN